MPSDTVTGQAGHYCPKLVRVDFGSSTPPAPGFVTDWRQVRGQWEAFVFWADGGGFKPATVHAQWLQAAHVKPVE